MKIYIISSLNCDLSIKEVDRLISKHPDITFLRPPKEQLNNRRVSAEQDINWIREANECWVVGRYGRDCNFEIGFATGLNKPIKLWVSELNEALLEEDWMIFASPTLSTVYPTT